MPKYLLLKHYRGGPEPHREPGANLPAAASAYAEAARRATNVAQRDHLVRQAARAPAAELPSSA